MAEAWIQKFATEDVQVFSAGTHPEKVNPKAIHVMHVTLYYVTLRYVV